MTFKQLKDQIRAMVFPSGEQENLVSAHDQHFQEGMALLAKFVPCLQANNVNTIDFCNTYFNRGMSTISAPGGVVKRVFAVANRDFDDPIFYTEVNYETLRMFAINLLGMVGLLPTQPTVYPLGFSPASASTDCACGRARVAFFAKNNGNIYTAPWLQSMETLCIEWDGVKTSWADGDPFNWGDGKGNPNQDFIRALKEYLQFAHERDFGSLARAEMFYNTNTRPHTGIFATTLSELMWQCDEERKLRDTPQRPEFHRIVTELVIERGLPTDNPTLLFTPPLHGHGPPAANAGSPGDTYVDDDANALYWKTEDGWKP